MRSCASAGPHGTSASRSDRHAIATHAGYRKQAPTVRPPSCSDRLGRICEPDRRSSESQRDVRPDALIGRASAIQGRPARSRGLIRSRPLCSNNTLGPVPGYGPNALPSRMSAKWSMNQTPASTKPRDSAPASTRRLRLLLRPCRSQERELCAGGRLGDGAELLVVPNAVAVVVQGMYYQLIYFGQSGDWRHGVLCAHG